MDRTDRTDTTRRSPKTIAAKVRPITTPPAQAQALSIYASALEAMQHGKFEKAAQTFAKLGSDCPPEVRERVRVYVAACERYLHRAERTFSSPEERYDYAISLINTGDYEEARDQLEAIVRENNHADYAHYGLAMLSSMTGQAEQCLDHMSQAIALNPQCRIQARSDGDFRQMTDDPRFTELLYPEAI
jgi:outer membrane protein assembly factor BamD (BamD/ComL family)